jgi:hypothetical protein
MTRERRAAQSAAKIARPDSNASRQLPTIEAGLTKAVSASLSEVFHKPADFGGARNDHLRRAAAFRLNGTIPN